MKLPPKKNITPSDVSFIVLLCVAYAIVAIAVVIGASHLMISAALPDPLPYARGAGPCPPGSSQSGAFCVPRAGVVRQAVPRNPALGSQCPIGWRSSAAGCVEPRR